MGRRHGGLGDGAAQTHHIRVQVVGALQAVHTGGVVVVIVGVHQIHGGLLVQRAQFLQEGGDVVVLRAGTAAEHQTALPLLPQQRVAVTGGTDGADADGLAFRKAVAEKEGHTGLAGAVQNAFVHDVCILAAPGRAGVNAGADGVDAVVLELALGQLVGDLHQHGHIAVAVRDRQAGGGAFAGDDGVDGQVVFIVIDLTIRHILQDRDVFGAHAVFGALGCGHSRHAAQRQHKSQQKGNQLFHRGTLLSV